MQVQTALLVFIHLLAVLFFMNKLMTHRAEAIIVSVN